MTIATIDNLIIKLQKFATVTRSAEWWAFKGAPVLATAYATASILNVELFALWQSLLFLLVSLAIVAIYANLLNDLTDRQEDLLAGKSNGMVGRSSTFIVVAIISCLLPGFLAMGLLLKSPLALGIYVSIWVVFMAYSIPPIRLKQRGLLGVLADAIGAHLLPSLFAVVWVAHASDRSIPVLWIILVGIWSLTTGLRGIFWHQIKDIENDRLAGVNTFAVQTSAQTLHFFGKWVIFPVEVLSFAGMLFISGNSLAAILMGLYLITEWLRSYFWRIHSIIVSPFANHSTILVEYYHLFYPLAFLIMAVWHNSLNLAILVVNSVLYFNYIWRWCRDFYGLLRWDIPKHFNHFNQS
jgi:4-hydroxybenzoate polyprenyltransferase